MGTDTAKDAIFSRLRLEDAGPRYIHFPHGEGFDEEYFRQLTAEEIRTRMKNGFPIRYWKKIRDRNECLDTMVYSLAALDILNPNFERLAENMVKEEPEPEDPNPVPSNLKEPKKPQPKPRGGGFVNGWR